MLTRAATAIADFQQHIAELDPKIVALGTSVTVAGGKIAEAAGTLGLMGSALALTKSAASLELAAAKLAVNGGGLPDAAKKGSRLAGLAKGALGITAIGGLAELAKQYDTLQMPEFTKEGIGRGLLGALDPNLPDMVLGKKADEIGKDAGVKVGKGVAEGVKEKAPEVEAEGKTLFQRLNEQFREGIFVPIHFMPGESMGGGAGGGGAGLIQKASFGGTGGLEGMVRRASIGGGSGGGVSAGIPRFGGGGGGVGGVTSGSVVPYSGGGRGISARDMRNIDPEFAAHIRASALSQGIDPDIALRIANSEGLRGSNPNRLTPGDYENGKPTSFGPFQLHYGRSGGLGNRYTAETGHHASDPRYWKEQIDFALRTARKEGWGAWYGRKGAGIGLRDGIGTVKPVPMAKDGEPKLVKGLDGKEGLDLGNGTMKMPDGSIRSITRSGLEIPDAPAGGLGGGRGSIGAAAERMNQAVDRMEGMGFHGQISLAVTGSGRQQVRATALKVRGRGGMTADLGISEPGVKEDLSDWT